MTIPVRRFGQHGFHDELQDSFERLLPLLAQLRHVRFVTCFKYGLMNHLR